MDGHSLLAPALPRVVVWWELREAEKVLSLIFKDNGRTPELRFDFKSPLEEIDLLRLGLACCESLKGRDRMIKDLDKKIDKIANSLKPYYN